MNTMATFSGDKFDPLQIKPKNVRTEDIADIIRPVKIHLQNYLEIEAMIMNCIWEKYELQALIILLI